MSGAYFWLKALHIIFVVTWFAGLFYLPRLFVYHADAQDAASNERFKVMERKLYRAIMNPSMILALVFGISLLGLGWASFGAAAWLWIKVALVGLLVGYHHVCGRMLRDFANDANTRSHTFFRWFNELPALILIGAVILVVVKPF